MHCCALYLESSWKRKCPQESRQFCCKCPSSPGTVNVNARSTDVAALRPPGSAGSGWLTPRHSPAALQESRTVRGPVAGAARPPSRWGQRSPGFSPPRHPVRPGGPLGCPIFLCRAPQPQVHCPFPWDSPPRPCEPVSTDSPPPPWRGNSSLRPLPAPCKDTGSMLNEVLSAEGWPFGDGDRVPGADRAEGTSLPGCHSGWQPRRHCAVLRALGIPRPAPSPDGAAGPARLDRYPEPPSAPRPGSSARSPDGRGSSGSDIAPAGDASEPVPAGPCSPVGAEGAGPAGAGPAAASKGGASSLPSIHPPSHRFPAARGDESVSGGGKVKKLTYLKAGRDH